MKWVWLGFGLLAAGFIFAPVATGQFLGVIADTIHQLLQGAHTAGHQLDQHVANNPP